MASRDKRDLPQWMLNNDETTSKAAAAAKQNSEKQEQKPFRYVMSPKELEVQAKEVLESSSSSGSKK